MTNERVWMERLTGRNYTLLHQETFTQDGQPHDRISFRDENTGETKEAVFNVSPFFGKTLLFKVYEWDYPTPDLPMPIKDILEYEESPYFRFYKPSDTNFNDITLTFKTYSSEMVGSRIVYYDPVESEMLVTTIRTYIKQLDIPILHSYVFYRMFIEHQLVHNNMSHDARETEVAFQADYFKPNPGVDCESFTPLPGYNFANDLLNYTFYTHKPGALYEHVEQQAFLASIFFGLSKNSFKIPELLEGIQKAKLESKLTKKLEKLIKDNISF